MTTKLIIIRFIGRQVEFNIYISPYSFYYILLIEHLNIYLYCKYPYVSLRFYPSLASVWIQRPFKK